MYRDYEASDARSVETVVGYRKLFSAVDEIVSVFPLKGAAGEAVGLQVGSSLYSFPLDRRDALEHDPPMFLWGSLPRRRAATVPFRGATYLLGGEGNLLRVTESGCTAATDEAEVPLLSLSGSLFRSRNLLSRRAREEFLIGDVAEYAVESGGLRFLPLEDGESCRLVSAERKSAATLYIPETVMLNGKRLRVTEIGEYAFFGALASRVSLPVSLRRIENNAFRSAKNLVSLVLPDATESLGDFAFADCPSLREIYCGASLLEVGIGTFHACPAVTHIRYPLSEESFREIRCGISDETDPVSFSALCEREGVTVTFAATRPRENSGTLLLPLSGKMVEGTGITLDGQTLLRTPTPLFPDTAENLFSPSAIAKETNREIGISLVMRGEQNGAFYLIGSAEGTVELSILTLPQLPAGTYRLSGTPDGTDGRLFIDTADGRFTDTGSGVSFSLEREGSVTLGLLAPAGAGFTKNEVFTPTLLYAAGTVSGTVVFGKDEKGSAVLSHVEIATDNLPLLYGRSVTVTGNCAAHASGAFLRHTGYTGELSAAVTGCTVGCVYDGRLFLSGNPSLPGTVFYSDAESPDGGLFFGEGAYFTVGGGAGNVTVCLPVGGYLLTAVNVGSEGQILLHRGESTGKDALPRIYPTVLSASGLPPILSATAYGGDTLLLTEKGVLRVRVDSGDLSLSPVSGKIDLLLGKKAGQTPVTAVMGDLFWLTYGDGEVFLLDRHIEERGVYAAYRLTGIGAFHGDRPIYEYAAYLPSGTPDGLSLKEGAAALAATGETVEVGGFLASREGDALYLVKDYGERGGGTFQPATAMGAVGGLLFFGTKRGDLLVFNTDLRYADGRLPRDAYSFMGHRYRSGLVTRSDNCDAPHIEKNTLRRSAVMKTRLLSARRLTVGVRAGNQPFTFSDVVTGDLFDFGALDFEELSFLDRTRQTLPLLGAARRYAETQYCFYTEGFCDCFAPLSLTFLYTLGGPIKHEY